MPAGGIDGFRDLLDGLTDSGLLNRISQPGPPVAVLPGRNELDLRYSISVKGIQHLKDEGLIGTSKKQSITSVPEVTEKEVFVTYSWDSREHNEKVISFTNFLRDEGFNAEMDLMHSQAQSAVDFMKMMHQIMTDYKKVIIVLSKGYKQKAEAFQGGVGNEYNLILKDMDTHPNKYILVSFDGIHDELFPLYFKGRQVIDLSDRTRLNDLYAKLKDEPLITFSPVGAKKPEVVQKEIAKFSIAGKDLELRGLISHVNNSSQFAQEYTNIEFDLSLEYNNPTDHVFGDYSIEVHYPVNSTGFDVNGRIEGEYKVITYDNPPKIFAGQTRTYKMESLIVRDSNVRKVLNSALKIKVFTENGTIEKEFPLAGSLVVKNNYGQELVLTPEMFRS
ncbi:SEFIR domain-containing protein [Mucilaginibacter hurinus]|nr:SEFIR domain-containing protein [Mucilaginibacter hurinus]